MAMEQVQGHAPLLYNGGRHSLRAGDLPLQCVGGPRATGAHPGGLCAQALGVLLTSHHSLHRPLHPPEPPGGLRKVHALGLRRKGTGKSLFHFSAYVNIMTYSKCKI